MSKVVALLLIIASVFVVVGAVFYRRPVDFRVMQPPEPSMILCADRFARAVWVRSEDAYKRCGK